MTDSQLTETQLKDAAARGEKQATKALSVLAKRQVGVSTTQVKTVDSQIAKDNLDQVQEQAIISYTRAVTGISGASLLSLHRKDALNLVDLFNNRPAGTTVVMQEIDRSTIRETLNILANAYITELAKVLNKTVLLSVPQMVTRGKLSDIIAQAGIKTGQETVMFETVLSMADVNFEIKMFFFFLSGNIMPGQSKVVSSAKAQSTTQLNPATQTEADNQQAINK